MGRTRKDGKPWILLAFVATRQATAEAAEKPVRRATEGFAGGAFAALGVVVMQHCICHLAPECLTKVNQINKLPLCCGATSRLSRCRAPRNRSLSAWFAAVATVKEVA